MKHFPNARGPVHIDGLSCTRARTRPRASTILLLCAVCFAAGYGVALHVASRVCARHTLHTP